jgi:hypothetical protein
MQSRSRNDRLQELGYLLDSLYLDVYFKPFASAIGLNLVNDKKNNKITMNALMGSPVICKMVSTERFEDMLPDPEKRRCSHLNLLDPVHDERISSSASPSVVHDAKQYPFEGQQNNRLPK